MKSSIVRLPVVAATALATVVPAFADSTLTAPDLSTGITTYATLCLAGFSLALASILGFNIFMAYATKTVRWIAGAAAR